MKLKKIITMGLAAIMAISAMSISAMAKEVVEFENGITMTIYAPGELAPESFSNSANLNSLTASSAITNAPFSVSVPPYSGYAYLNATVNGMLQNSFFMGGRNKIRLDFASNNQYTSGYQALHDDTSNSWVLDIDNNIWSGPYLIGSTITFSGLNPSHYYSIGLATNSGTKQAIGTLSTTY